MKYGEVYKYILVYIYIRICFLKVLLQSKVCDLFFLYGNKIISYYTFLIYVLDEIPFLYFDDLFFIACFYWFRVLLVINWITRDNLTVFFRSSRIRRKLRRLTFL